MTTGRSENELPPALTDAALAPLWKGLHRRFGAGRSVSNVSLGGLDAACRAALADLLGSARYPGQTIPLARLDDAVRSVAGVDTRAVVERFLGPIEDRAARRADAVREREELWTWLREHPVVHAQPVLEDWIESVRRSGMGPTAEVRTTLERALRVLDRLPADGGPLPSFADSVLHDPHALDDGTRLAGLVLRAVAVLMDVEVPDSAEQRRRLWGRVGVAEDELSSTVLAAGLRPEGDGMLPVVLRACAAAGQAVAVTLAQVQAAADVRMDPNGVVHVVENPSILALALRRFGQDCPPLVCVSGWPSGAAILLLRTLGRGGARIRYHGDLDGDGLRIAAYVVAKTRAVPWRMTTCDYLAAVPEFGPPAGRLTSVPWDAELVEVMRVHDVAVVEERVSDILLDDLAVAVDPAPPGVSPGR